MLESEQAMQEAAGRLAVDIGGANQAGCSSSRVTYVIAGKREDAAERVTELPAVGSVLAAITPTLGSVLVGIVAGALVLGAVNLFRSVTTRAT